MLSSEFAQEMGALVRRLENRIILEPGLKQGDQSDLLEHLEECIVVLASLYITEMRRRARHV